MSNKTDRKIDHFEIEIILSYLNSNSKKIFNEIILANKNNMWATIIVFSLTILDNIFHQDDTNDLIEGLDLNKIKYSKDIIWLRKKRNEILHYENSNNNEAIGFFSDDDLKIDSFLVGNCVRIKNQTNSVKGLHSNVLKRTALIYKNQKFEHSYPKINYFSL